MPRRADGVEMLAVEAEGLVLAIIGALMLVMGTGVGV